MMFPESAIFEIAAFLVILPLIFVSVRIIKFLKRDKGEEDVRTLFFIYWNGTEEDEIYAWYKVRHILLKREREDEKLKFVERKISEINKSRLYGEMSVNETGNLVDKRSSNPKIL